MLGVVTRIAWPELTDTPAGAGLLILYELGLGDGLGVMTRLGEGVGIGIGTFVCAGRNWLLPFII